MLDSGRGLVGNRSAETQCQIQILRQIKKKKQKRRGRRYNLRLTYRVGTSGQRVCGRDVGPRHTCMAKVPHAIPRLTVSACHGLAGCVGGAGGSGGVGGSGV